MSFGGGGIWKVNWKEILKGNIKGISFWVLKTKTQGVAYFVGRQKVTEMDTEIMSHLVIKSKKKKVLN